MVGMTMSAMKLCLQPFWLYVTEIDVQAEPLINPGSLTSLRSNSQTDDSDTNEPEGLRGYIFLNGFWGHGNKRTAAIIDVRVTDVDAASHRNQIAEKVLESQEKSKKSK